MFAPLSLLLGVAAAVLVDVALLHTDSGRSSSILDVIATLNGTGLSVKEFLVNIATPTLEEIRNTSQSVLVFSGLPFANNGALGDVLADFVDAGGNVVVMYSAQISYEGLHVAGRFQTVGMHAMFSTSFHHNDGPQTMVKVVPNHPLLESVSSFDGGLYSYRPHALGVAAGALLVANWSTGEALIAVFEPRSKFNGSIVSLGFTPQSSDQGSRYWNSSTDGAQIMANAVRLALLGRNTATLRPAQSTPVTRATASTTLVSTRIMTSAVPGSETAPILTSVTITATPIGQVVGGAVGSVAACLGLLLILVLCWVARRRKRRDSEVPSSELPTSAPIYHDTSDVRAISNSS
jgi:hypothetical protein